MLEHELLVHDRSNRRRQTVQHEARRVGLVDREDEGLRVGGLRLFRDIVAGEAELRENEGRALVELDGAFERIGDVLGGDRIAGGEFHAGFELERIGQAVIGDRPAFGEIADDLGRVVEIEPDEQAVGIAGHLGGRELESFARIDGDDVVEREALDQRILRRFREGRLGRTHRHGECRRGGKNSKTSVELMHHVALPSFNPSRAFLHDDQAGSCHA